MKNDFDEPRRVEKEPGFFDKLKDLFETNRKSTFELKLTPKERSISKSNEKNERGWTYFSYESTEKERKMKYVIR